MTPYYNGYTQALADILTDLGEIAARVREAINDAPPEALSRLSANRDEIRRLRALVKARRDKAAKSSLR